MLGEGAALQGAVAVALNAARTSLLSGGAHGFLYPGLAALVTDVATPARRATAVGVFSAMFLVGQAAGAFAFGWVAHVLGYASMWTILACSLLIGAALSMGLARPTPAPA